MSPTIRTFDDAMRRNLAVRIVCGGCGRESLVAARSMRGWVPPDGDIGSMRFRCRSCGKSPSSVRYLRHFGGREGLTPWSPPDRPPPYPPAGKAGIRGDANC